jgi:plasmid stabilization system protein ParE
MSFAVTFLRAARSEFIEAAARYETQRPGLGARFIAEIDRCVASAAEQPLAYAVIHNDIRRVTARRFPFSVYFRLEAQRIVVLAVFHGRRSPAVWQNRG